MGEAYVMMHELCYGHISISGFLWRLYCITCSQNERLADAIIFFLPLLNFYIPDDILALHRSLESWMGVAVGVLGEVGHGIPHEC